MAKAVELPDAKLGLVVLLGKGGEVMNIELVIEAAETLPATAPSRRAGRRVE